MKAKIEDLLRELEKKDEEERKLGIPSEDRMRNIPPETGRFLNMLVKASKARRVLEIGTSNAYSTIWLGLAAKEMGGKVITLEKDERKIMMARENLKRAELLAVVQIIEGDALKTIKKLRGPFDFVFIDAEKEDYLKYFDLVYPKTSRGGLIVADNAGSHAEELADYLERVRNHPGLESVHVPIGRGEEVSYKRA